MIIKTTNNIFKVYGIMLKDNLEPAYYYTDSMHIPHDMVIDFYGSLTKNIKTEDKNGCFYISEDSLITGDYLYWEFLEDFTSDEERKEFEKLDKEVKKILPEVFEKVEIDYIKWKIKNNQLEEWQNNFKDKIFPISEEETFIDDEKYDIFYNPNDLNGEIKVLNK